MLRVPDDIGRRYAAVSGDVNPIHLNPLAAKAFGFPRAIAHGMWTHARSLAALEGRLPAGPLTVRAQFAKPVLLPSTVALHTAVDRGRRRRRDAPHAHAGPARAHRGQRRVRLIRATSSPNGTARQASTSPLNTSITVPKIIT